MALSFDTDALAFQIDQTFDSGAGETGSEVVAYEDGRIYVTNGADQRIDIFNATSGVLIDSVDLSAIPGYDGLTSVTVKNGVIAAALLGAPVETDPDVFEIADGQVALIDAETLEIVNVVEVGNHPDMVTFSSDGNFVYVANEGELSDVGDGRGGVSVIDLSSGAETATVVTVGFDVFAGQEAALADEGIRFVTSQDITIDLEPEYISEENGFLYVSVQEANAIAVFDLEAGDFVDIFTVGVSDHSQPGFGLDASDRDDAINIQNWPVFGIRMPDSIATYDIGGETYIFTANEGDAKDEEERLGDVTLDPTAFPNAAELQLDENLGRLNITNIDGDTDGDGDFDELYAYGSRSFTILDANGDVVFDSGDDFEQLLAQLRVPNAFNNDGFPSDEPSVVDDGRSDNKGPEPEAIAVGEIGGRTLAFIGLERDSGIMIYDVSDPESSEFVQYIDGYASGNVGPEVIRFIPAADAPSGLDSIAVSYEISGTTVLYALDFGKVIVDDTAGGSTLSGSIGDDTIFGLAGDDTLSGGAGDDELYGMDGFDTLVGGQGDDLLDGGANPSNQGDILLGGAGDDTYLVDSGLDLVDEGAVFASQAGLAGDIDTIISTADFFWDLHSVAEKITISEDAVDAGGDGTIIVAGVFNNVITGDSGTNVLFGRGGSDTYRAGDGVDFLSLSTLGLTDENSYVGVDSVNTVIVEESVTGDFSYDVVFEFESGKDRLDVSDYGYGSASEVLSRGVDDGAGSSYFVLGDGFDYLYMVGLELSDLTAGDFIV